MADILHRVGIKSSSVAEVYSALTTTDGLAGWWTSGTTGVGDQVGGVLAFRFGAGGFDMKVVALDPGNTVVWEVLLGPEEWIGTRITWQLKEEDGYVIVLFKHADWRDCGEMMHHCSTKWAVFLMSLKERIETGSGRPDPMDTKIDNWN